MERYLGHVFKLIQEEIYNNGTIRRKITGRIVL